MPQELDERVSTEVNTDSIEAARRFTDLDEAASTNGHGPRSAARSSLSRVSTEGQRQNGRLKEARSASRAASDTDSSCQIIVVRHTSC